MILYAIIRADGNVAEVKVLEGFDDRLDENARKALAGSKVSPEELLARLGDMLDALVTLIVPWFVKLIPVMVQPLVAFQTAPASFSNVVVASETTAPLMVP